MLTALSALAVAVVTAAGAVATAVVGRRQPRGQRRRDDFAKVTERLDKDIERLERRVTEGEAKAVLAQQRITAQDFTIRYLAGWVRSLVSYVREARMEPPPPPQPVPPEVQPYLHDVGL
ncbi:hypothetical protein ACFZB4_18620 [Streptomyces pseudovenezuelae]|uniref:hypothetical protein n=1 Tax=Streptomyces pseudovenezuelae TaxID=67350 RepID=UPI0036E807D5